MRRLAKLGALEHSQWGKDELALERHALTCLKAVHPFLAMAAAAMPLESKSDSPPGDSPTPNDELQPESTDDGVR